MKDAGVGAASESFPHCPRYLSHAIASLGAFLTKSIGFSVYFCAMLTQVSQFLFSARGSLSLSLHPLPRQLRFFCYKNLYPHPTGIETLWRRNKQPLVKYHLHQLRMWVGWSRVLKEPSRQKLRRLSAYTGRCFDRQ